MLGIPSRIISGRLDSDKAERHKRCKEPGVM